MPRANDNRKAVGTEHCNDCGTLARFYQVQRGNRTGYLYRRCECGADQSIGAAKQHRWLETMDRTAEPLIPHPLKGAQVETPAPAPKPDAGTNTPEPRASGEGSHKTDSPVAGAFGLLTLVGAVALAIFT